MQIAAQRTISYRGALKPAAGAPIDPIVAAEREAQAGAVTSSVSAIPRNVIYVIPGCYLGNVPPESAALPETCDPSRVIISKP